MQAVVPHRGVLVGGLSNQLMAFFGMILFAHHHNASIALPHWSTHFPGERARSASTSHIWGELFWPDTFPPITSVPLEHLPNGTVTHRVSGWGEHTKYMRKRRHGDRKSVVSGKRVPVRVDHGGRRTMK